MKKLIATTTLCAAMALNPISVQPAQALSDEAKAALFGLAGIAIIYGIADANKKEKQRVNTQRNARIATASCRRTQWTHSGNRRIYRARCLERSTTAALPTACRFRINTSEGTRRFYTADCLRQYGWRA